MSQAIKTLTDTIHRFQNEAVLLSDDIDYLKEQIAQKEKVLEGYFTQVTELIEALKLLEKHNASKNKKTK